MSLRRHGPAAAWVLGCALSLVGCGGSSIAVLSHPHPDFAPAEPVSSLPPPARVEQLTSAPPAPGCLWADGQWVWTAQRWDWRPGAWIKPREGCRYSAPSTEWVPVSGAGVLYYRPGRWYSVSEPRICPEPVPCLIPPTPPANRFPDS